MNKTFFFLFSIALFSVIALWDGAQLLIAQMLFEFLTLKPVRSSAFAVICFALSVLKIGMNQACLDVLTWMDLYLFDKNLDLPFKIKVILYFQFFIKNVLYI